MTTQFDRILAKKQKGKESLAQSVLQGFQGAGLCGESRALTNQASGAVRAVDKIRHNS